MADTTPDTTEKVKRTDSIIYFYDEINDQTALQFIQLLREAEQDTMWDSLKHNTKARVLLYINSPGGDVTSMFSMIDAIEYIRVPVVTLVTGAACSGAALLALAGTQRLITPNAYLMVHQLWGTAWGTLQQLEDEMYIKKQLHKRIVKHICSTTYLTKKETKRRLKRDWWLDAAQAIEDGFVDGVWDGSYVT